MKGRASHASTSSATVTTSRPSGYQRVRSSCHTGRSKRQPHQDAHATSNAFRPRRLDSLKGLPSASGKTSSGATGDVRARPVTVVSGPNAQMPCGWSATRGMPSRSEITDASSRPSPRRATGGSGTHASALHRPCGLIDQPVRVLNSCSSTFRSCRITCRTIDAEDRLMREHRYELEMPHSAARIWALFQDYDRWTDYAPMVKRVDVLYPGDYDHNGRLRR